MPRPEALKVAKALWAPETSTACVTRLSRAELNAAAPNGA